MKVIERKHLLQLAGIDSPLGDAWKARGIIRHPYNFSHTVGVALAAWLRRQGIEIHHAANVAAFVSLQTPTRIRERLAGGYCYLVLDTASGRITWAREDTTFRRYESGPTQLVVIDVAGVHDLVRPKFEALAKDDSARPKAEIHS